MGSHGRFRLGAFGFSAISLVLGCSEVTSEANRSVDDWRPAHSLAAAGETRPRDPECDAGRPVWHSVMNSSDLGKKGNSGLFENWGEIRTRPNWTRNLDKAEGAIAPDGSLAYKFTVPVEKGISLPMVAFDQTPGSNLKHVYAEFEIWFPDGYWSGATKGQKFWGLWTQEEGGHYSAKAGREVVNNASSEVVAVPSRLRTYSYYRNRPEAGGDINDPDRAFWKVDEGRWVRVGQEIKLNDPGKSNGFLRFFIDGEEVYAPLSDLDWIEDSTIAGLQGFSWSGWSNGEREFASYFWTRGFLICDLGESG